MCVPRRKGNIVTAAAVVIGKKKSSRPRRVYRERSKGKLAEHLFARRKKKGKYQETKSFPVKLLTAFHQKQKEKCWERLARLFERLIRA